MTEIEGKTYCAVISNVQFDGVHAKSEQNERISKRLPARKAHKHTHTK